MTTSYIIYTNNSQKYITKLLKSVLEQIDDTKDELIIVDDLSEDNTVPCIVGTIGYNFMNEEHYKFYINQQKEGRCKSLDKMKSIAKGDFKFIINKKGRVKLWSK